MKLAAKWDYREGLQSMSVAQAVEYEYGLRGGGGQLETKGHAINGVHEFMGALVELLHDKRVLTTEDVLRLLPGLVEAKP